MMVHLYLDEKDINKIIAPNEFVNQDFKPSVIDLMVTSFYLFSKLENKNSSEINFYKFTNFTFYSHSRGRCQVLRL